VAAALAARMTTGEAAVLVGGCVVIPGGLLAELLHELQAPRQTVPMGVVQPHRSPAISALVDLTRQGAIAHNRATTRESSRKRESLSRTSTVTSWEASVVAGSLSIGGEVVGVDIASGLLGFSPQWVRVLASSGALPGARKFRSHSGNGRGTARIRWCIPLAAVHAYLADRQVT
jgi:hypothetical protein